MKLDDDLFDEMSHVALVLLAQEELPVVGRLVLETESEVLVGFSCCVSPGYEASRSQS